MITITLTFIRRLVNRTRLSLWMEMMSTRSLKLTTTQRLQPRFTVKESMTTKTIRVAAMTMSVRMLSFTVRLQPRTTSQIVSRAKMSWKRYCQESCKIILKYSTRPTWILFRQLHRLELRMMLPVATMATWELETALTWRHETQLRRYICKARILFQL